MSKIFDSIKVYGSGTTNSSSTLDTYDSGGTTTFTIKDGGNVGIGTNSPTEKLFVSGKTYISESLGIGSSAPGSGISLGSTYPIYFGNANHNIYNSGDSLFVNGWSYLTLNASTAVGISTNNINRLYVNSIGNVGIGTSSPSEKLEVNGDIKITSQSNVLKIGSYSALSITQGAGAANVIVGHNNTMNDGGNGGGVVIGASSTSTNNGIAIGLFSTVSLGTDDGIAIGRDTSISNSSIRGVAIGRQATVTASNAFAIGNYTTANQNDTIILGNNSSGVKPNVGIGTSNPLTTLHVNGKATIQGDVDVFGNVNVLGTATTLNTETVQTRDNKILLNYSGTNVTAVGGGISVLSANTIYTSGLTELITDINGDWNSNVGLNITGRTSDNSSNGLTVKNSGGTNNFVVRNDGNVGIGTSTPTERLEVNGKTKTTTLQVTSGSPQVGYVLTATDTDGNAIWSNPNQSSGSTSVGSGSTAFGVGTSATTEAAFSTGFETQSTGFATASFGKRTRAIYEGSFATGSETLASGAYSSTGGIETSATTSGSTSVGYRTIAESDYQSVFGVYNLPTPSEPGSFIIGNGTDELSRSNLLKAYDTTVTVYGDIQTEGIKGFSPISIYDSMVVTGSTVNSGATLAFSFGENTNSIGNHTFTLGSNTIASHNNQVVVGKYNLTASTTSAFIIGNGVDNSNRSNLMEAADSNVTFYGNIISSNFGSASSLYIERANGTKSSPTSLNSGDTIGTLNFLSYDSTDADYNVSARISSYSNGSSSVSYPGGLTFSTTPGGVIPQERMRIDKDGKVGIGINNPTSKLHINNTTSDSSLLVEDSTNPDSTPFIIDTNGNVGIGTTTPSTLLDVSGKTKTTTLQVTSGATTGYILTSDSSGNGTWQAPVRAMTYLLGHDSVSPTDSNTYYIGNLFVLGPLVSSQDSRRVTVQRSGTITDVGIMTTIGGSLGSGELSTFTINNVTSGTSSTITTGATHSGDSNINYTLSSPLTVTKNDKIEVRWVTPVWVTNPTTVRQMINVVLSY